MPTLQITPTGGALGAEVRGLDLSASLESETVEELRTAFYAYSVLCFRAQAITKIDLVRFSGYFGQPVPHPTNSRDRDRDFPEITLISNIQENGTPVGALGNDEIHFHADLVFLPRPGTISLLYCVEAPQKGGDTLWTNGYAAYEALDDPIKNRIDGLTVSYVHRNPAYNPPLPPAHPLVCIHPETGRRTLFFSPSAAIRIDQRSAEESRELLQMLYQHATHDRFVWRHRWQRGDLVMWDNRCTMHRREAFDDRERRLMWRTQMLGPCTA